jgi:branched-chain amino acid transport system ATP-binding protein
LLKIENLTVEFGKLVAVNNFNMEVKDGEIHGLIGPNGAGKTTVFNAIYNFVPYKGKIFFNGKNLRNFPTYMLSYLGISRTYQNLSLFPTLTVYENIALGLYPKLKSNFFKDILGFDILKDKNVKSKVFEITNLLNITYYQNAYPIFLPYGIQKLVELGRSLISEPKLLLLDEPAAGLTKEEKVNLINILKKLRELGYTILIVEHDMELIMDISTVITVMNFGNKISEGTPDFVSKDKNVIEAYLGEG